MVVTVAVVVLLLEKDSAFGSYASDAFAYVFFLLRGLFLVKTIKFGNRLLKPNYASCRDLFERRLYWFDVAE